MIEVETKVRRTGAWSMAEFQVMVYSRLSSILYIHIGPVKMRRLKCMHI